MTGEAFKKLQIGKYVTDVLGEDGYPSHERKDYCAVQQFDSLGRIKLQPYGQPAEKAFWIHYKDYDLKEVMFLSELMECTVI
jgi:hypothetical protein